MFISTAWYQLCMFRGTTLQMVLHYVIFNPKTRHITAFQIDDFYNMLEGM